MKDKVVVITGASAGIGAALARLASKQGAQVALVARRERALATVAAECGPNALPVVADVTKRADVDRAYRAAVDRFGRIDVWVNNAGRGITRLPSELSDDDIDEMMQVNVKSALYGAQAVLPHFKARTTGHLINISSMLGRVPFAVQRSAYSASKHFLNSLTANLRMELKATHPGIHVSLVSPGVVATEFGLNALHGGVDSRTLPNSQTAEQVAAIVADVISAPRADVYTPPHAQQLVVGYYAAADLGIAEDRFGPPNPGAAAERR